MPEGLVDDIAARLASRFGDRLGPAAIEDAVRCAYDDLDNHARIRTFLPVLAERAATERIAAWLRSEQGVGRSDNS